MKTQKPVDPGPPKPPPPPPGGGGKAFDWVEFAPVAICMFFLTVMSIYHLSYDGYLGISNRAWGFIWAVSENGLAITMTLFISLLTVGVVKIFFRWVLVPYFILRLIYHISCYASIYLFSPEKWEQIWSIVLIVFILLVLIYTVYLTNKKDVA